MKKLVTVLVLCLLLLTGCASPANSENAVDYGEFKDYFSELSYEVRAEDGTVSERMYILYDDEAHESVSGTKDVFFDVGTGKMTKYLVALGSEQEKTLVSYSEGDNSSYYSEFYLTGNVMTKEVWDNEYRDSEGDTVREKGEQDFFDGGSAIRNYREEVYRNGELESTTVREYAEDGSVLSESVE